MKATVIETNLTFTQSPAERQATNYLTVHHTGGNAGDDHDAARLHSMHQRDNGWIGIGYHFVIRKDGAIERGRPVWAKGAHSVPGNGNSIGIHVCGNFDLEQATPAQIESLSLLCGSLCTDYSLEPSVAIVGHRDQDATDCPGQNLYDLLPVIRGKAIWYQQQ